VWREKKLPYFWIACDAEKAQEATHCIEELLLFLEVMKLMEQMRFMMAHS